MDIGTWIANRLDYWSIVIVGDFGIVLAYRMCFLSEFLKEAKREVCRVGRLHSRRL